MKKEVTICDQCWEEIKYPWLGYVIRSVAFGETKHVCTACAYRTIRDWEIAGIGFIKSDPSKDGCRMGYLTIYGFRERAVDDLFGKVVE